MQMRREQSRSVAFLYGGIAGVLLMVIATVALIVAPPSPPSVAEFAPGALETIDDAPEGQLSRFGVGSGSCPPGMVCDPVTGELIGGGARRGGATTIERARVRRCVGDPPRQIEDPQSPPCVNYWEGDNGGATSRGVTGDEIRLVIPDADWLRPFYEVLTSFFNSRFEFYGRQIRIVLRPATSRRSPEGQRVNAVAAYEAGGFAASSSISCWDGRCQPYWREAARLGLITVTKDTESSSEQYGGLHPYAWSYLPARDRVARYLAEFSCKSLMGRPARHAGGAEMTRSRRLAVLQLEDFGVGRADATPLIDGIRACGGEVSHYEFAGGANPTRNRLLIADLQQQGVTTIIIYGHDGGAVPVHLMPIASGSGYQPEWLIVASGQMALESWWQPAPEDQRQHLFGLTTDNKGLASPDKPYTWAYQEMGQSTPEDEGNTLSDWYNSWVYHELLILASGIQAAGPNLTPESFARGLQSLTFPNPGAAAPPYYQGTVGFSGNHFMIEDAGLMWWSPTAPAYSDRVSAVGGWCYVDRGARWRPGGWPEGEPNLFDSDPRNCR